MSTGEDGRGSEQDMLPIGPDAPVESSRSTAADEEHTAPVAPHAPPAERVEAPRTSPTPPAEPVEAPRTPPTPPTPPAEPVEAPRTPPAAAPSGQTRLRAASIPDGMLTVEDHLEKILRGIGPLAAYDQPLVESLGLPLHESFVAPMDLPLFDNSAMDGYAVRAEDVASASRERPVTLPVVGEIQAGSARPFAISAGTAVKIMTGAPIPRGADAVVPYEQTDRGNARVQIFASTEKGQRIRPKGDDVTTGDTVLAEGTVLGPREIGLLAALGAPRVKARPRPRVVVISTGSELREPGTHLDYDSINDGNSYMLAAAVREAGAICYRVGAVDDNPRTFQKVLSEQLVRADLVVTSGGISKGDHDVVKQTLSALGTVEFNEVAMQPGKPQGFGKVFDEQTPIITLPGNAVSAYVSFEVFVLPAIRRMMGRTPYRRPMVHAVLAADLQSRPGVRQYVRGVFEVTHRGAKVTPLTGAGSHMVGTLAQANALIIVGEDQTALNLGDTVRTLVLDRPF
ncbi:molybdotransferase-like divisome protein Glp [Aeromicrobium fastidiosum]|uniref:molybdotransferase-like divisome protein Glp n=1 Tax=Aeromicrobium fastidiosum TaxID=52699 RepID=UPI001D251C18|nr:gephyrin-like molybdotransferase Glp [Aeromicrobium fastidiosum]MBP2389161.1 molybdopterin molybdotransferase [Aeromicrobium fastidiosum]